MKLALLCNSRMAIPSLQLLAQQGLIASIGIPDTEHDGSLAIREVAPYLGTPLTVFSKQEFAQNSADWLKQSQADALLVYTFPFLLNEETLSTPPLGCFNFHFGLLPQYRGPDAIFWEIRNREPHGAVSIHRMETSLDTGPIVLQQPVPIGPNDTYGMHLSRLAMAGMRSTWDLLGLLQAGPQHLEGTPQDESLARLWGRPGQTDVLIDWEKMTAVEILALIRACNPWNKGAYTFLNQQPIRITTAHPTELDAESQPPGTLLGTLESGLRIACIQNESLLLETIYVDEGFYGPRGLQTLGIAPGIRFTGLV